MAFLDGKRTMRWIIQGLIQEARKWERIRRTHTRSAKSAGRSLGGKAPAATASLTPRLEGESWEGRRPAGLDAGLDARLNAVGKLDGALDKGRTTCWRAGRDGQGRGPRLGMQRTPGAIARQRLKRK
jgi:hypothetical protein